MIPMKLVEPVAKSARKIMKLSLHFREFILPKEFVQFSCPTLIHQCFKITIVFYDGCYEDE
jgi:hypothetical protein